MTHHDVPHRHPGGSPDWWVLSAWASLALLIAGGLAGAAGLG
jgi:hypothetical protein